MKIIALKDKDFLVEMTGEEIANFVGKSSVNTYGYSPSNYEINPPKIGNVYKINELFKRANQTLGAYESIKGSVKQMKLSADILLQAMEDVTPKEEGKP